MLIRSIFVSLLIVITAVFYQLPSTSARPTAEPCPTAQVVTMLEVPTATNLPPILTRTAEPIVPTEPPPPQTQPTQAQLQVPTTASPAPAPTAAPLTVASHRAQLSLDNLIYLPMVGIPCPTPTSLPTTTETPTPIATETLLPTDIPMLEPTPTATQSRANCDPSYPTVCIPSPPPDLDCKDIPYRNFQVLPPDPHHFDGDHDGIGRES